MKRALIATFLEMFSEKYVPPHLRRVYPAAFSLFIAAAAIFLNIGTSYVENYFGLLMDAYAFAVAGMLFVGWAANKQRWTINGFWCSTGLWTAVFISVVTSVRAVEPLLFGGGLSLAMINLSLGAWLLMRKDPNE